MLGIIIGIMAVVVLVSIVGGATDSVAGELNSLGAETLSVTVTSSRYQPLSVDDVVKPFRRIREHRLCRSYDDAERNAQGRGYKRHGVRCRNDRRICGHQ